MTLPAWPIDELGRPQRAGYGRQAQDGRKRLDSAVGPSRMRRRTSAVVETMRVTLIFDRFDKLRRFERFWDEDTSGGVGLFTMPHPERDNQPLLGDEFEYLLDENGDRILADATALCQFGSEPPQVSNLGVENWQVQFTVVILP
jgi:hypothetical protein